MCTRNASTNFTQPIEFSSFFRSTSIRFDAIIYRTFSNCTLIYLVDLLLLNLTFYRDTFFVRKIDIETMKWILRQETVVTE